MASAFFASPALAQDVCDFGAPNPEAPVEINQFEFLVGNHRIEARIWQNGDWTQGYAPAEWNGRWGIDGWAVIDEWFGPQLGDNPQNLGVNVRYFNEETGRWSMVWQATNGAAQILEAELRDDGNVHMWQVTPEPAQERFIYFLVHSDTHWSRIDGLVLEDGTHQHQYRLDAFEVPCEG